MIYLIPSSGLGNRMRAVDSGIAIAESLNLHLNVYWTCNHDLNCPFHMLFEPFPTAGITIYAHPPGFMKSVIGSRTIRNLLRALPLPVVAFSTQEMSLLKSYDFISPRKKTHIFIRSYSRFYPNQNKYDYFKPIPELRDKISERTATFDEHVIGVHIRRTDHVWSITHSPDTLFMSRMQDEIDQDPLTRFYLATDSPEVKKTFINRFGDRIITTSFQVSRDTPEGIQEALVELYSLAATSKILGSYGSSFSTTAAELGKIEMVRILTEQSIT